MATDLTPTGGVSAEFDYVVTEADTALALGSGDVAVLGTPRVLGLLEQATVRALAGELGEGQTSVGVRVELDHLRPSRVGDAVQVSAVLVETDRGRMSFRVLLRDHDGRDLATGFVVRAIALRSRFL